MACGKPIGGNDAALQMEPQKAMESRNFRLKPIGTWTMKITRRVKEILANYESDNPGTKGNLARILMEGRLGGTGKMIILPVDQGFEHGPARSFAPNPAGYDPHYHYQMAIDAGCNAYAAPLGFLEAVAGKLNREIPLILKLNNNDTLSKGPPPCSAITRAVKGAG